MHPVAIPSHLRILLYPLAALLHFYAFTASICQYYILGNYGHARSQGGRQPATAKPPLYFGIIRIRKEGGLAPTACLPLFLDEWTLRSIYREYVCSREQLIASSIGLLRAWCVLPLYYYCTVLLSLDSDKTELLLCPSLRCP